VADASVSSGYRFISPAGIDWLGIRRLALDSMRDLMQTAPEPARTEAALGLCRHRAGVMEAHPTAWRAIIAEAVDIVGRHAEGLEKRTQNRSPCGTRAAPH
jgi:hypothetical protein